jgi:transposase
MDYYAGIDVALERSRVCVLDTTGRIVREAKVPSEPEALVAFLRELGVRLERVGLEAGPLSHWLHAGLVAAGLPAVLIETRHVRAALKAMTMKTDRLDVQAMACTFKAYLPGDRSVCRAVVVPLYVAWPAASAEADAAGLRETVLPLEAQVRG